jgi:hypothetical protein
MYSLRFPRLLVQMLVMPHLVMLYVDRLTRLSAPHYHHMRNSGLSGDMLLFEGPETVVEYWRD